MAVSHPEALYILSGYFTVRQLCSKVNGIASIIKILPVHKNSNGTLK
jgi:hypothetical protein